MSIRILVAVLSLFVLWNLRLCSEPAAASECYEGKLVRSLDGVVFWLRGGIVVRGEEYLQGWIFYTAVDERPGGRAK